MDFSLDVWKQKMAEHLSGWRGKMQRLGVNSVYAAVSSSVLWPVVAAFQSGDFSSLTVWGSLAAGAGGSLIANKIQGWKDQPSLAKAIESEAAQSDEFKAELDTALQKLNAFELAKQELPQADHAWFVQKLKQELETLGNVQKFNAVLKGSGTIQQGEGNVIVKGDVNAGVIVTGHSGDIIQNQNITQKTIVEKPGADSTTLKRAYLNHLFEKARQLNLAGIDPKATDTKQSNLNLDAVYTALLTQTPEALDEHTRKPELQEKSRYLSAVEQLNENRKLVILGDPGSGKSTFVNFVTLCHIGELLQEKQVNLKLLTAPLPSDEEEDAEKPKPQPWSHGGLLPVRIILRDFAVMGLPVAGETADSSHLWNFIVAELPMPIRADFGADLKQYLLENGGLILLDGLDEVPEADKKRQQIKDAIEDFAAVFKSCRFLVTSRVYAYQKQNWRLSGFAETTLAPFTKPQIRLFIERWYQNEANCLRLQKDDAAGKAETLKNAVFRNDRLLALAYRPLLLTLMTSLHAWRGGDLPEKREQLYAAAVDLLLDLWERPKMFKDKSGKIEQAQPGLVEYLKVKKEKVRWLLQQLAFDVHAQQDEAIGTADVAEADLVQGLMQLSKNPDVNPAKLLVYLTDRAGLLLPRGDAVYTFPHRTFQEYLAACHLTELNDFSERTAELLRSAPNRWREVTLLAAAKAAKGSVEAIWALVNELIFEKPNSGDMDLALAWGSQLAGQILVESARLDERSAPKGRKAEIFEQAVAQLVRVLACKDFPAIERVLAGRSLAELHDPRDEVVTITNMPFCYVPAGIFSAGGSDKNSPELEPYYISKYPVTQAQFAEFVKARGYLQSEFWPEAQALGWWSDKGFKGHWDNEVRTQSVVLRLPFGLANHPVVGVSWYEALAFTRWLNASGFTPQGMSFALPTEWQWEKAGSGGAKIPAEPAANSFALTEINRKLPKLKLVNNPQPRREYPWGDEASPERANYAKTEISATSAVGCFPGGASPYGCEEMSGNVWEWCLTKWRKNYEKPEDNEIKGKESRRVLRGGAYYSSAYDMRCAYRISLNPNYGDSGSGFRIVLSPCF